MDELLKIVFRRSNSKQAGRRTEQGSGVGYVRLGRTCGKRLCCLTDNLAGNSADSSCSKCSATLENRGIPHLPVDPALVEWL